MTHHLKKSMSSCLLASVLTLLLVTTAAAKAAPLTCGTWSIFPTPNPGASNNRLNGVAALSSSDVWAVGSYSTSVGGPYQTLVEHWDGTSWSVVPSPNGGTLNNALNKVAAVSATDIWAVGTYVSSDNGTHQVLIEHWDGTSWSVVAGSASDAQFNELYAVVALSTSDDWAVGGYNKYGGSLRTLVEHWDGTSWSTVGSPNPGRDDTLHGVVAVSATDIWAVGNYFSKTDGIYHPLIEHWNGTRWRAIANASGGTSSNALSAVAAVSASDLWAVGDY